MSEILHDKSDQVVALVSSVLTSQVGVVKVLNAIHTETKESNAKLDSLTSSQAATLEALDEMAKNDAVILEHLDAIRTRQDAIQEILNTLKEHLGEMVQVLVENQQERSLEEVESTILAKLQSLDYRNVFTTLIETLEVMQGNTTTELTRLGHLTEQLERQNQNVESLVQSNETMAARIASIDLRTAQLTPAPVSDASLEELALTMNQLSASLLEDK
jgi:hypothetical protein